MPQNLGEGAVVCPFTGNLLYIDVVRGNLFVWDPVARCEVRPRIELRQPIGFVVPVNATTVVAALLKGVAVVNTETGAVEKLLCQPEYNICTNRMNDGKCDPQGRLWVGSMDLNCQSDRGTLYRISGGVADGDEVRCDAMLTPTTISNGICWSADGATMFYIDTALGGVDAFDFDGASGTIANRRTVVRCAEGGGHPDGMTIDRDDKLWVAMWGGSRVNRYCPESGTLLSSYPLPCAQVTSCAFGGVNYDQLFITTAKCGLSAEERAAQPLAGCLFRIDFASAGIAGVAANAYR